MGASNSVGDIGDYHRAELLKLEGGDDEDEEVKVLGPELRYKDVSSCSLTTSLEIPQDILEDDEGALQAQFQTLFDSKVEELKREEDDSTTTFWKEQPEKICREAVKQRLIRNMEGSRNLLMKA